MAYEFPPDVERLVNDRMAGGRYSSHDELLRDALRALDEIADYRPEPGTRRIANLEDLRHEIWRGIRQLDAGEGRSADEVFDDLLRDLPAPTP